MRPAEGVGVHSVHMGVSRVSSDHERSSRRSKGWNSTAFGTDAVMREGGIADRVQPVQLAGDTKSRSRPDAERRFRQAGRECVQPRPPILFAAPARPVGHAGRTQAGGPKQVAQKAGRPDPRVSAAEHCNRPPPARMRGPYCNMRGHAIGKASRRHGATMVATITAA